MVTIPAPTADLTVAALIAANPEEAITRLMARLLALHRLCTTPTQSWLTQTEPADIVNDEPFSSLQFTTVTHIMLH